MRTKGLSSGYPIHHVLYTIERRLPENTARKSAQGCPVCRYHSPLSSSFLMSRMPTQIRVPELREFYSFCLLRGFLQKFRRFCEKVRKTEISRFSQSSVSVLVIEKSGRGFFAKTTFFLRFVWSRAVHFIHQLFFEKEQVRFRLSQVYSISTAFCQALNGSG